MYLSVSVSVCVPVSVSVCVSVYVSVCVIVNIIPGLLPFPLLLSTGADVHNITSHSISVTGDQMSQCHICPVRCMYLLTLKMNLCKLSRLVTKLKL